MLRLLAVIAAAAARPEDATAYFDAASRLWPPTSTAGRCLAAQRQHGWRPKPHGSNFKTLGTEGVGHHLCGNQISDAPPSTRRVLLPADLLPVLRFGGAVSPGTFGRLRAVPGRGEGRLLSKWRQRDRLPRACQAVVGATAGLRGV